MRTIMEKNRMIKLVSPKGYAQYPWLNTPDTKFDNDGVYCVTLKCDDNKTTQDFISKLEEIRDNFYDNDVNVQKALSTKKKVNKADVCEYDDEGNVLIKFKQKAKIKAKDGSIIDIKIPLFDSKTKPMNETIGRDSVIKIATQVFPYFMQTTKTVGLSLKITAVQVLELKEATSGSGAGYGFGEEEGFEHKENPNNDTPFEEEDDINDF